MSDSNKQALLLIAITVCLVLVLQPNVMSSFVKKAEAPRRVLSESELQLFTTTANTGEIVMVGANGVLIDQGSQAVRVGTDKITMIASNKERVRVTSSGLEILPATPLGASGLDKTVELMSTWNRYGTTAIQNSCSFGVAVGAKEASIASDGRVDLRVSKGASENNGWGSIPDTTIMTLTGSGNVGIGTTDPEYKLKIEQGFSVDNNGLFISNSNYGSMQGLNISMVNAGSGNFYSYASIQGYKSGVSSTTHLALQPSSGNVGIGTTDPLQGKLQVAGRSMFGYIPSSKKGILIDNEDAYAVTPAIQGVSSGLGVNDISINPAGGLVGIGTNEPMDLLHVVNSSTNWSNIRLGKDKVLHNDYHNAQIYKNQNVMDVEGDVGNAMSSGGDLWLQVGGVKHTTWNGRNYGGGIILRAGTILSRGNNGSSTSGYEAGGDIIIDSGGVVAISNAGPGPYKRGGHIYFRTGKVQNINTTSAAVIDSTPWDYVERMKIDGDTGNVGIGTSPQDRTTLSIYKNINIVPQEFKVGGSRGTYYKVRITRQNEYVPASFTLTREIHQDGLWTGSMNLTCEFRGDACGNGSGFIAYKYTIYGWSPNNVLNKFVARCSIDQSTEGGCTGSHCWLYLNGNTSYYFTGNNCFVDYYSPNGAVAGDANPTLSSLDWPFENCGYIGRFTYDSRDGKHSQNGNNMFLGNVGIGTTDPKGTLNVHKTLGTNDYTNGAQHASQIRITNGIGGTGGSFSRALEFALLDNGTGVIQACEMNIGYNKLCLNPSAGNVGVGTDNPAAKLHVYGGAQVDGILRVTDTDLILGSSATGRGAGGRALVQGHDNTLIINFDSDFSATSIVGTTYLGGSGSKSIEIGTSSNTSYIDFHATNSYFNDYDARILANTLFEAQGNGFSNLHYEASRHIFSGTVGIGTTNPDGKLQVTGPILSWHYNHTYYANGGEVWNPGSPSTWPFTGRVFYVTFMGKTSNCIFGQFLIFHQRGGGYTNETYYQQIASRYVAIEALDQNTMSFRFSSPTAQDISINILSIAP